MVDNNYQASLNIYRNNSLNETIDVSKILIQTRDYNFENVMYMLNYEKVLFEN